MKALAKQQDSSLAISSAFGLSLMSRFAADAAIGSVNSPQIAESWRVLVMNHS
jgi:hypothetical protein